MRDEVADKIKYAESKAHLQWLDLCHRVLNYFPITAHLLTKHRECISMCYYTSMLHKTSLRCIKKKNNYFTWRRTFSPSSPQMCKQKRIFPTLIPLFCFAILVYRLKLCRQCISEVFLLSQKTLTIYKLTNYKLYRLDHTSLTFLYWHIVF